MCSLRTVGYDPYGRPRKVDEGPSNGALHRAFGGTLIVGEPGVEERRRTRERAKDAALKEAQP